MNLRIRLALSIAVSFVLALILGGGLAIWRADASVQTEMQAALKGGIDILADLPALRQQRIDPLRLARSFNGLRHLRATLSDPGGRAVATSLPANVAEPAPQWFERLIAPEPLFYRAALSGPPGWTVVLKTDPRNEIAEVWGQTRDAVAALLFFCGGIGALVYLLVVRFLGFLPAFANALDSVAQGNYGTTLVGRGPPEFAQLAQGYNHMATRLSQFQDENGRLQRQIVEVQEEERAEIARDLHDEVGPYLFSINVDAEAIPELTIAGRTTEVEERVGRIREAAGHIQKQVKSILRQLNPVDVLDFGLDAAIRDLFAFWQIRDPELRFDFDSSLNEVRLDRRLEEVIYRVVQESVSNAVRHAAPTRVAVSLAMQPDGRISVAIRDDGIGLPSSGLQGGSGLAGMAERLHGVGGRLNVENNAAGPGVSITAILPSGKRSPAAVGAAT